MLLAHSDCVEYFYYFRKFERSMDKNGICLFFLKLIKVLEKSLITLEDLPISCITDIKFIENEDEPDHMQFIWNGNALSKIIYPFGNEIIHYENGSPNISMTIKITVNNIQQRIAAARSALEKIEFINRLTANTVHYMIEIFVEPNRIQEFLEAGIAIREPENEIIEHNEETNVDRLNMIENLTRFVGMRTTSHQEINYRTNLIREYENLKH